MNGRASSSERRASRDANGRFLTRADGRITGFDRAFELLTGWSLADLHGVPAVREVAGARERGVVEQEISLPARGGGAVEVFARVLPAPWSEEHVVVEVRQVIARVREPGPPSEGIDPDTLVLADAAFRTRFERDLWAARAAGHPLALAVAGVHGEHEPAVLRRMCAIISASVRQGDLIGRVGVNEFGIVLLTAGRGQARHAGTRLAGTVERFGGRGPDGLPLGLSIGVAACPADGTRAEDLLARARQALGEAMQLGPGRVWCHQRRERRTVDIPAILADDGSVLGRLRDLSDSGAFVESSADLPVDMRVGLTFELPGLGPIRVIGRIARRVGAGGVLPDRGPGLGIEFDAYGEDERIRLDAFLK